MKLDHPFGFSVFWRLGCLPHGRPLLVSASFPLTTSQQIMAVPSERVASLYWKQLNGLLCLYKPPNITLGRLVSNLKLIIPPALNRMITRQPRKIVQYDATFGDPMETVVTDYSDHPLVIGPRYDKSDIHIQCHSALTYRSSGVCVVGLNYGRHLATDLEDSKPFRVYHILGELGVATDNLFKDGKVVEKATYSGVFRPVIDRVVASMQASHQRFMFMNAGVSLQSQEAYELAVKGLLRPTNDGTPVIYGIKCISFERPFFTIEVTCTNEREEYLLNLIHTIGIQVKSVARCNGIKCIRYGPYTLEHALLQHAWKVENFVQNIKMCTAINEKDLNSGRRSSSAAVPLTSEPEGRSNGVISEEVGIGRTV